MTSLISSILPTFVLVTDLLLVLVLVCLVFRKNFGREVSEWVGKRAIGLGLLITLSAVAGSLFYSNVVGFLPCDLCWWQRVLVYPQLVIFLTAMKFKDRKVFRYSWRLSVLAALVSIYHVYVQLGGNPLIPCSATATCTKIYVSAYGYITIPTMALTISAALIILAWANKLYEDRHA